MKKEKLTLEQLQVFSFTTSKQQSTKGGTFSTITKQISEAELCPAEPVDPVHLPQPGVTNRNCITAMYKSTCCQPGEESNQMIGCFKEAILL